MVTFTEEIINVKLHFLCSVSHGVIFQEKFHIMTEAAVQRYSVKKVFFHKISQNSKESTCAEVSFSIKLQADASRDAFL